MRNLLAFFPGSVFFLLAIPLHAQSAYFNHVFFDNSLTPDRYYHSRGKVSAPSTLRLIEGKLPVDTSIFRTPPNALRLDWKSTSHGGWEAEVRLYKWRNRNVYFPGDTLYFWCYAPEAIRPADFPRIVLKDKNLNFTAPLDISTFVERDPCPPMDASQDSPCALCDRLHSSLRPPSRKQHLLHPGIGRCAQITLSSSTN